MSRFETATFQRFAAKPSRVVARWAARCGTMARFADSRDVDSPCEQCAPPAKSRFHQRVAHMRLCRRCVERMAALRRSPAPLRSDTAERWALLLAYGGLISRTLFYAALFFWASRGGAGAAALQGVVAADVITFLLLGAFQIPFKGLEITVDGLFQFALIVFFLNRAALFSINDDAEFAGTSFLFFLAFAAVRMGVWGVEQAGATLSGT